MCALCFVRNFARLRRSDLVRGSTCVLCVSVFLFRQGDSFPRSCAAAGCLSERRFVDVFSQRRVLGCFWVFSFRPVRQESLSNLVIPRIVNVEGTTEQTRAILRTLKAPGRRRLNRSRHGTHRGRKTRRWYSKRERGRRHR